MVLDVFAPTVQMYPFSRAGGLASTIAEKMDAGTDTRRLKRQASPVELGIRLGGTKSELATDVNWIETRAGHTAFKFKDPWDYSVTAEAVGTGNASRTIFYLDYKYIDSGNIVVKLDGTPTSAYTLSNEEGKITFDSAPGSGVAITADYEFYRKFYFEIINPASDIKISNPTYGFWMLDLKLRESLV